MPIRLDGGLDMRFAVNKSGMGCLGYLVAMILFIALAFLYGTYSGRARESLIALVLALPLLALCIFLFVKWVKNTDKSFISYLYLVIIIIPLSLFTGLMLYNMIAMPGFILVNGPLTPPLTVNQIERDYRDGTFPASLSAPINYGDESVPFFPDRVSNLTITGYEDDRFFSFNTNYDFRTHFLTLDYEYLDRNNEVAYYEVTGNAVYRYNRIYTPQIILLPYHPWGWTRHGLWFEGTGSIDEVLAGVEKRAKFADNAEYIKMSVNKASYTQGEDLSVALFDMPDEFFNTGWTGSSNNYWLGIFDIGAPGSMWHDVDLRIREYGNGMVHGFFIGLPETTGILEVRLYTEEPTDTSTAILSAPFLLLEPEVPITRIQCYNEDAIGLSHDPAVEIRHSIRREAISGSVFFPPLVSEELCYRCGEVFSEPETNWFYVWVSPLTFVLFVFLSNLFYTLRSDRMKMSDKNVLLPIIASVFPFAAILTFLVAVFTESIFESGLLVNSIIYIIIAALTLIPFSLIYFSLNKKGRVIRWGTGLVLAAGITIGLIIGGGVMRGQEGPGYLPGYLLSISGVLYGAGCITALICNIKNSTLRAEGTYEM